MTGRLPKGADLLVDIRCQGFRPTLPVFVYLDADRPRPTIYRDLPVEIEICIRPSDAIEELDFRSLVDLVVAVVADSMSDRLLSLLKAIRRANPASIGGGIPSQSVIFAWTPAHGWETAHV